MSVREFPKRVLTVSELTLLVRAQLEHEFSDLWVEGEVSNVRMPASGHMYFTLKDQGSQIRAVLFRSSAHRLRFDLREGLQVLVRGRLTVYEPRGEYQLVSEYLEPKGIGALQIQFEQLKEKLAREGLFDTARKRPLPVLPRRVGIVTSISGAAVRDMITVIQRRCPILEVQLYPVLVQGDQAAPDIAEGIEALSRSGDVDVMIVGRGGGSWEDLWPFNEEIVVRAIVESRVPVVSAVGHEIDFTLADFAADYRAATPSAAAEAVAPVLEELIRAVVDLRSRQKRAVGGKLALLRQQALTLSGQLPLVRLRLVRHGQYLDDVLVRLVQTFRDQVLGFRSRVTAHRHTLGVANPLSKVRSAIVLGQQMVRRMEQGMRSLAVLKRQLVVARADALHNLSPLAILGRGYSIVQHVPDGRVIRNAQEVSVGDEVRARLDVGQLLCQVRKIIPGS